MRWDAAGPDEGVDGAGASARVGRDSNASAAALAEPESLAAVASGAISIVTIAALANAYRVRDADPRRIRNPTAATKAIAAPCQTKCSSVQPAMSIQGAISASDAFQ